MFMRMLASFMLMIMAMRMSFFVMGMAEKIVHVMIVVRCAVCQCHLEVTGVKRAFIDSGNSNRELLIGQAF